MPLERELISDADALPMVHLREEGGLSNISLALALGECADGMLMTGRSIKFATQTAGVSRPTGCGYDDGKDEDRQYTGSFLLP